MIWRHAAALLTKMALVAVRAVLHAGENVEQSHLRLLRGGLTPLFNFQFIHSAAGAGLQPIRSNEPTS